MNEELVHFLQVAIEQLHKKERDTDVLMKLEEKLFLHQFQLSDEMQP